MRRFFCLLLSVFVVASCWAQVTGTTSGTATVPPMIRFSGTLANTQGTVGVLFSLYEEQTGGAPLWQEFQVVSPDTAGHFTAILGSRNAKGIPAEIFGNGRARWVAAQAEGQSEQLRALLVSVPYAVKAFDAETLGGFPASAFLRADSLTAARPSSYVNDSVVSAAASSIGSMAAISASGAALGYLPVFTDAAGDLGNSALFQATNGNVGIGTATPAFNLDIASITDPAAIVVEGFGNVGVNFIGQRAQGVPGHPTSLNANDNIMTMQGRGYGATGYSPLSRAYMKFFAAENWTDAAQGTYVTLATTPIGSVNAGGSAPERLRITDAGLVGIGTAAPSTLLEVNGTAKFDGLVTFAAGQTFPGASVSISSPDASITVGGTGNAPTVVLNTGVTNLLYAPVSGSTSYAPASGSANYLAKAGGTMTGPLTLPANGLQMTGNQMVTSGGQFGYGVSPSIEALFDIGGSMITPTPTNYGAELLRIDGSVKSSYYGQAYLRGMVVTPNFDLTQGYANYLSGIELNMNTRTGTNVAHSIVGFNLDAQPTSAVECSVGFGINVPNQNTSLCNGSYGFYEGAGSTYNYFAANTGIGTPFPSATLEVNGTAKFDGLVTFASGQTFPGAGGGSVTITSPDSSITVGGTTSAPTVALNTGFTTALYVPKAGGTMTGALTLPANGLQMANSQIVTSAGQLGYGASPNAAGLVDIGGSMTAPTYEAELLRLDGTVRSSSYAQAYLKGIVVAPTFNITGGYANYLTGIDLSMAGVVAGSNVAHSVVGYQLDGQPTNGLECSVGFGIGVPNQQTSLCYGSYGFYQAGGAQYNFFASNVGIGTPFPTQALTVQGNVQVNGNLNATGTIQSNGEAGAIATLGTPASSSAPCTPPQLMYDSNFVYTCVATNSWRRTASTSF